MIYFFPCLHIVYLVSLARSAASAGCAATIRQSPSSSSGIIFILFHLIFTSLALTNCLCVSYTCRLRHFVRGTVRTEGRSSSQVGLPVKLFIDLGRILDLGASSLVLTTSILAIDNWQSICHKWLRMRNVLWHLLNAMGNVSVCNLGQPIA